MEREERKALAIKCMKDLNIYCRYVNGFAAKAQKVCYFENFGGFWVYQDPALEAKMKEIEKEYDCTVYAITHEFTEFGECYDFLIVSKYDEDAPIEKFHTSNNCFYAYAYVWNITDDWCSEFGDIAVESFGGGIKRIA